LHFGVFLGILHFEWWVILCTCVFCLNCIKLWRIGPLHNLQPNLFSHTFKSSTKNHPTFPSKETLQNPSAKETNLLKTEKVM